MFDLPLTVANFLLAMQAGQPARGTLDGLFCKDCTYVESFSGTERQHHGRAAVIGAITAGWQTPLPQMHLRVDHVAVEGPQVLLDWTCLSPALPGGSGQGQNRYQMRKGLIARLETTLKGPAA